ncbi:MAG: glutamate--tRNA ligase [Nanoarchaeota archaeon]
MDDKILVLALENAIKFKGKANPKALLGKIMAEFPEAKEDMKTTNEKINKIVNDVNEMSFEEQEVMLKEFSPNHSLKKEKKEKKYELFGFLNIPKDTKVKTAFPPGVEKYPHIGHAKAYLVNYLLAKEYNGEFVLRFEDTNPELVRGEFFDTMKDNFAWLNADWDELYYASDFMQDYYKYAEILINEGKAYVCFCDGETIKKSRQSAIPCECRQKGATVNKEYWDKLSEYEEGKAIVRLKIDLAHQNSTMRDPSIFRINKTPHARQGDKYKVWPTYDFQTAISDGLTEITHRLRSKEFEMRGELQQWIQKACGLPVTSIEHFARFNMEGVLSSGRVIREKIQSGELVGWDDPTLTTLVALRRRGFLPEAIKNFVISTGITKSESTLTWDDLIMHNKRLLDKGAMRYFFVRDPVKVKIKNAPLAEFELRKHPEDLEKGYRRFKTGEDFYLCSEDVNDLEEGDIVRLMDGFNIKKKNEEFVFYSHELEDYKNYGKRVVHWLPATEENINASVMMPDKTVIEGLAEKDVSEIKEGVVIQFERFGFCRLDDKEKVRFWFTHR